MGIEAGETNMKTWVYQERHLGSTNTDRYANTHANTGCSLDCLRYISRIEYRRDSDRRRWRGAYRIYNRMGDAG
jgi:hypothetical protein